MDIASACLAGIACRYDGNASVDAKIKQMYEDGDIVLVCPEVLGGLDTPRCPCEIVGGSGADVLRGSARVLSRDGADVTQPYIDGAKKALEMAQKCGARHAYLKSRSPSCGYGCIYDGSFSGKMKAGAGVAAVLLRENGIDVVEI